MNHIFPSSSSFSSSMSLSFFPLHLIWKIPKSHTEKGGDLTEHNFPPSLCCLVATTMSFYGWVGRWWCCLWWRCWLWSWCRDIKKSMKWWWFGERRRILITVVSWRRFAAMNSDASSRAWGIPCRHSGAQGCHGALEVGPCWQWR